VLAAIAASISFFVAGQVRGWASPAIPSLQGFDGQNNSLSYAPLSKEAASWISKLHQLENALDLNYVERMSYQFMMNKISCNSILASKLAPTLNCVFAKLFSLNRITLNNSHLGKTIWHT
jgi:hypothetical protein